MGRGNDYQDVTRCSGEVLNRSLDRSRLQVNHDVCLVFAGSTVLATISTSSLRADGAPSQGLDSREASVQCSSA